MTSIRIGLAGLGTAGRSLPQAVAKTEGYVFAAGADLRQEAREQYRAEFGIPTFESVAAMCEMRELEAVYVATPNPHHAEHAITALESGKHVMVEKAHGADTGGLRPDDCCGGEESPQAHGRAHAQLQPADQKNARDRQQR